MRYVLTRFSTWLVTRYSLILFVVYCSILELKMVLKYNRIFTYHVVALKSKKNENVGLTNGPTFLPVAAGLIQQEISKRRPSSTNVKTCEPQTTILVCDCDGKFLASQNYMFKVKQFANLNRCMRETDESLEFISLNERAAISHWRRKVQAAFDCLCVEYGVTKIQTNNSSFIAVSGMQTTDDSTQAIKMVYFAVACQRKLHSLIPLLKLCSTRKQLISVRFGIHCGAYLGLPDQISAENENNFRKVLHGATIMQKYVISLNIIRNSATTSLTP